ncbi:uncharacterized protein J4E88_005809 [Alternaria novae-zelandiae]|uniref:uncharacterized protein n=1 Tax=Alternaria novae-zelandiae TaxID=430562 RepID=UPI0020C288F8|nr:uncharacterized protein J4E88_005809 [Alternaria novae-zelandiae]KAI4679919.1 hypothetical protein J4E88_005809 [Alternaria novae-zelandiae]
MGSTEAAGWRPLSVGIIGGGIGGLSTAIALRRAGHMVTIYERNDFAGEAGASVSCAANGTRWLHEWGVDVEKGDPVVLKKLINRDWTTGEPEEGEGMPVKLLVNHPCQSIHLPTNQITFSNNTTVRHDLIIGADGIGSVTRKIIGLNPEKRPAESSCLHANVLRKDIHKLGLEDYSLNSALEYWGGQEGKWDKIVLSPCNGGELLSYYCFFPREKGDYANQTWGGADLPVEELLAPYPELDEKVKAHLAIGIEVRPWRLWVHQPYPYVVKDCVALIGDAAHPMMPHQSQGACMAIEDAAALGILFSKNYFRGDVQESLAVYEKVRLPRATKVQASAAKAASNINERIGFSSNTSMANYKVEDEAKKLTIEEMNAYDMYKDIDQAFAEMDGVAYTDRYVRGLPFGLRLSNGIQIAGNARL